MQAAAAGACEASAVAALYPTRMRHPFRCHSSQALSLPSGAIPRRGTKASTHPRSPPWPGWLSRATTFRVSGLNWSLHRPCYGFHKPDAATCATRAPCEGACASGFGCSSFCAMPSPPIARLFPFPHLPTGPFDPWPGGGATVFSPNFLCTGKPGNPYLLKTPPPPALNSSSGSGGLSGGAIAGIVVGCVAAAALAAALAFFVVRRRWRHHAAAAAGDTEKGSAGSSGADQKGAGTGPTPGPAGGSAAGSKDSAGTVAHGSARDSRGSAKSSQFESGSMDSAFAAAAAAGPDTDPAQLPADWNTGGCAEGCSWMGGWWEAAGHVGGWQGSWLAASASHSSATAGSNPFVFRHRVRLKLCSGLLRIWS